MITRVQKTKNSDNGIYHDTVVERIGTTPQVLGHYRDGFYGSTRRGQHLLVNIRRDLVLSNHI